MSPTNKSFQEPVPKKIRATSKLRQVTAVVNDLKQISESMTIEPAKEDQYAIFGRSVAAQLMTLTPSSAIKAQERIQSILTSFKLQDLHGVQYDTSVHTRTSNFPAQSSVSTPLQSPTYSYLNSADCSDVSTNASYEESFGGDISHTDIIGQAFSNI